MENLLAVPADGRRYPTESTDMNINRLLVTVFIIITCSPFLYAEYADLTPQWAKQNPGRLTLNTGTAMGGWNGYTFRLHFDSPKLFSLRSQVLLKRENNEGNIYLHVFNWSLNEPTDVLPINISTPSFTPPVDSDKGVIARADATVRILVRHLGPDGKPNGQTDIYDLTLSDFKGIYTLPKPDEDSSAGKADGG